MLMANVVKIIVVRVLCHATVEVRPRQNILHGIVSNLPLLGVERETDHRVLLVFDCLDRNLGEEVVVQHVCRQVRLNWQTLGEELLVEVLPGLLAHQDTATPVIFGRSACTTHHLENVHDGVVDISVLLALIVLHAHDDDHVT